MQVPSPSDWRMKAHSLKSTAEHHMIQSASCTSAVSPKRAIYTMIDTIRCAGRQMIIVPTAHLVFVGGTIELHDVLVATGAQDGDLLHQDGVLPAALLDAREHLDRDVVHAVLHPLEHLRPHGGIWRRLTQRTQIMSLFGKTQKTGTAYVSHKVVSPGALGQHICPIAQCQAFQAMTPYLTFI